MGMHQHARHLFRFNAQFAEGFHNHRPGIPFILAVDFIIGHFPGAGDRAVKIIGMGGARRGNAFPGLRPDGGVAGVGVHNAADIRKLLIQQAVSRRIGRGFLFTFYHLAGFNAHHDHVLGGHHRIIHPGRLDNKYALLAADGADVAPGQGYQVMCR